MPQPMFLLTAFLITLTYYAILIVIDQKRKKQFALIQQNIIPSVNHPSPTPVQLPLENNHIDTDSQEGVFGALKYDALEHQMTTMEENEISITTNISNDIAIAIDHLTQNQEAQMQTTLSDNIPETHQNQIANNQIPKVASIAIAPNT